MLQEPIEKKSTNFSSVDSKTHTTADSINIAKRLPCDSRLIVFKLRIQDESEVIRNNEKQLCENFIDSANDIVIKNGKNDSINYIIDAEWLDKWIAFTKKK